MPPPPLDSKVLDASLDDSLEPYFTIVLDKHPGRERNTVPARVRNREPLAAPVASAPALDSASAGRPSGGASSAVPPAAQGLERPTAGRPSCAPGQAEGGDGLSPPHAADLEDLGPGAAGISPLEALHAMGFDRDTAAAALEATSGDLDRALDFCCAEGASEATPSAQEPGTVDEETWASREERKGAAAGPPVRQCLVCQHVLVDHSAAVAHATTTGHTNFGSLRQVAVERSPEGAAV
mmetsp:Transcript_8902/g.20074  ORF Transcript_8902/g.20074 Transcript_8902/m.20074 type:complete len:238 (+) Transcript_8902:753-1466(+)